MGVVKEREKKVLSFIDTFRDEHGVSPTIMDIVAGTGMPRSTVSDYLKYLRRDGMITTAGHRNITTERDRLEGGSVRVPIYGEVACGQPIFADSNVMEVVKLPLTLFGNGDLFILHAQGQSMDLAGIDDGDWVVIRRCEVADPGQIVVALVDDEEATLKRYYPDSETTVRLQPQSSDPAIRPIIVDLSAQTLRIQGVVANVIKTVK